MSTENEHVKAMRWLYEYEKSYRKAAAKLKLEELKAQKEKALIRQYRRRQRRIWLGKVDTILRPTILRLKELASRRKLIYGAATLVVIGFIGTGFALFSHKSDRQTKTLGAFTTIAPDFKPAVTEGSQNLSTTENNNHKIVTYQDTVAGQAVIVSQQKLPESFKSDTQAITKLDQFKTAEVLDTPKGKLYITTNTTGQQWATLVYQDVLIFFQSKQRIGSNDWYQYIKTLAVK